MELSKVHDRIDNTAALYYVNKVQLETSKESAKAAGWVLLLSDVIGLACSPFKLLVGGKSYRSSLGTAQTGMFSFILFALCITTSTSLHLSMMIHLHEKSYTLL